LCGGGGGGGQQRAKWRPAVLLKMDPARRPRRHGRGGQPPFDQSWSLRRAPGSRCRRPPGYRNRKK